jgi:hypothetical protein
MASVIEVELEKILKLREQLMLQRDHNQLFGEILAAARKLREVGYGASVTKGRGDEELVRFFQDQMPALVKTWQKLPLFQFINGETNMDVWDCEINIPDGMTESEFGIQAIRNALDNLPFDHFAFYAFDYALVQKNWFIAEKRNDEQIVVTPFRKRLRCPVEQLANIDFIRKGAGYVSNKPDSPTFQIGHNFSCCAAYLQQTAKRSVEIRTENPRVLGSSKTGKKKPWRRDDLPYIILVDPTEAHRYGHKDGQSDQDRKSPKPHARRGHWRRYKATEKRESELVVFIRPMWIGPGEWTNEGKVYRIVRDKKQED